jgi:hypothetical protein
VVWDAGLGTARARWAVPTAKERSACAFFFFVGVKRSVFFFSPPPLSVRPIARHSPAFTNTCVPCGSSCAAPLPVPAYRAARTPRVLCQSAARRPHLAARARPRSPRRRPPRGARPLGLKTASARMVPWSRTRTGPHTDSPRRAGGWCVEGGQERRRRGASGASARFFFSARVARRPDLLALPHPPSTLPTPRPRTHAPPRNACSAPSHPLQALVSASVTAAGGSAAPPAPPLSPEALASLVDFVSSASRLLVLTGAGASTESGVPDYRSPGG